MKLVTVLRLVPKLRMSGAVLLLPLYAFMAWTETSSHQSLVANTILTLFSFLKYVSQTAPSYTVFATKAFFLTQRERERISCHIFACDVICICIT